MSLPTSSLATLTDKAGLPQPMSLPPGVNKCAIQECNNACYVDDSGTVHECCGYTHAMEHQRRQALWQRKLVQTVLKCIQLSANVFVFTYRGEPTGCKRCDALLPTRV